MNTTTTTDTTTNGTGVSARAALWASAFVLAALTILQAGRGLGSTALANTVSTIGDLTALTNRATVDEDVLCILDGRAEMLLVYRIETQNRLELQQTIKIPDAFAEARGTGGTQRPRR